VWGVLQLISHRLYVYYTSEVGTNANERQRRHREKRFAEIAAMPKIPCECGCGTLIAPITTKMVPARYARGHNRQPEFDRTGKPAWNKGKPAPWAAGRKLSAEHMQKLYEARLPKYRQTICLHCDRRAVQRDPAYCSKHYWRWKTYGDPLHVSLPNEGPVNRAWRGGVGALPYGPGFTRSLRRRIRERDGYRCRRCGITQEERGRTLEVHHLDHDKNNHSPDNLVTSCGKCNIWGSYHRDEPWLPL